MKNAKNRILFLIFISIVGLTSCSKDDSAKIKVDLTNKTFRGVVSIQPYWYMVNNFRYDTRVLYYNYLCFASSSELMIGESTQQENVPSTESEIVYYKDYKYTLINDSLTIYNSDLSVKYSGKYKTTTLILTNKHVSNDEITFQLQK